MRHTKSGIRRRRLKPAAPTETRQSNRPRPQPAKKLRKSPAPLPVTPSARAQSAAKAQPSPSSSKESGNEAGALAKRSKAEEVLIQTSRRNTKLAKRLQRSIDQINQSPSRRAVISSLSGVENPLPEFLSSNTSLCNQMMQVEFDELQSLQRQYPQVHFGSLRIKDAAWVTSIEKPEIHVASLRKTIWTLCSAVAPNFRAKLRLKLERGRAGELLVRWWIDTIFWGEDAERAEAAITKFQSRFQSPTPGKAAIRLNWLENGSAKLACAIAQSWKLTLSRGNAAGSRRARGTRKRENDFTADNLRLFRLLSLIDLKRTTFVGGQAKAVRHRAVQKAEEWLKSQRSGAMPVHPEGLLHFWADMMPLMGGERFKLPLITYGHPKPVSRQNSAMAEASKGAAEENKSLEKLGKPIEKTVLSGAENW